MRGEHAEGDDNDDPQLSVVIPCRNVERYLAVQLDALASQVTSFPWELVIVDNGSTDRTTEIAAAYADRVRLRLVPAPDRANAAHARNEGAKEARADRLVFVDADDEVTTGFLAAMHAALESHELIAAPRELHALNAPWIQNVHDVSESSTGTFPPFAFGSGVGVSRRAFESVSGYPEEYDACEDMAFSYLLQRSGVPLMTVPEALVRYRFRDSIHGSFRQTRLWGRYQARVYRDFPEIVPPRGVRLALREWFDLLKALARARHRSDAARCAVRLGYSVGRLGGSVRYRVLYL